MELRARDWHSPARGQKPTGKSLQRPFVSRTGGWWRTLESASSAGPAQWVAAEGAEAGVEIEESKVINDNLKKLIGVRCCRLTGSTLLKLELC